MRKPLKIAAGCCATTMVGALCLVVLLVVAVVAVGPGATWVRETETLAQARPMYGHVIQTRDGELFYQQHGTVGPIVVMAHGSGAWSQFWESAFEPLVAAGYRVVAFDMPPMGYSGPAKNNEYGRVEQANRISDLIASLGEKPILVGHSFGAGPMVEVAFQSPDRIQGLVIVNGALGLHGHVSPGQLPAPLRPLGVRKGLVSLTATNPLLTRTLLKQMVYRKEAVTDRHIEILQAPLVVNGATRDASYWLPSLLVAPTDALSTRAESYAHFQRPTHLIWGDKDTVTPLSQAEAIHALLPNSELTVLPDVGHIPHVEAPALLNAALIKALNDMQAAQSR